MTHNSSNTTETDEIEFSAGYGTAVATTGTRQRTIRSHQQKALAETSGNVASDVSVDAATDQD